MYGLRCGCNGSYSPAKRIYAAGGISTPAASIYAADDVAHLASAHPERDEEERKHDAEQNDTGCADELRSRRNPELQEEHGKYNHCKCCGRNNTVPDTEAEDGNDWHRGQESPQNGPNEYCCLPFHQDSPMVRGRRSA
jgi:hypothetical protein